MKAKFADSITRIIVQLLNQYGKRNLFQKKLQEKDTNTIVSMKEKDNATKDKIICVDNLEDEDTVEASMELQNDDEGTQ